MAWRLLAGRAAGTSHCVDNTPCEDYFLTDFVDELLCVFVADGAGSALCGGEGAKIACETALAFAKTHALTDEHFAHDCVVAIQQAILTHCTDSENEYIPRDFACTFLALLATEEKTLCFQVGDGAIIIDNGEGLNVVITPTQGEYANMTHFVSDDTALDNLHVKTLDEPLKKIALLTDGLQRLALHLASNTPHQPFFAPFFDALAKTPSDQEQRLQNALENFLNSESVNERTDDDKTLVLGLYDPDNASDNTQC